VIEGWNDELRVTQFGGIFPQGTTADIKFPPGFYDATAWATKFNELTTAALLPLLALHFDVDDEKIATLIFSVTTANHIMHITHANSQRKARNVLQLLGFKIEETGTPGGIPYSEFDMSVGVTGTAGISPMTFNWNNIVFLSCNISHSNSIQSDVSHRVGNVMEAMPIDFEIPRSCMVTMYHEEDAGLSQYYLDKGDSIQNMEFALLDKFGNVQQTYEEFEFHIMLRFDFRQ
tara:strand:- start:457 stop:1152 length:696 start_codon:yes stop_codon:yes gene_type:complete